jgi:hypothetical protein
MASALNRSGLICVSHLRWDFVYQRPQHLLSRVAKEREVVYFEEPKYCATKSASLEISQPLPTLTRVIPLLPEHMESSQAHEAQARLLERYLKTTGMTQYDLWYYTPMGTKVTTYLKPEVVIFDCMDELSGFLGAPPELRELEQKLLKRADVVFTGGASLYESKCLQHTNVHCCPSSIDRVHFAQARQGVVEPDDQKAIPHPRVGFYGVVDERFDTSLVSQLAELRPDLNFVIVGPVVKIDAASLPQANNIHYIGKRDYEELPRYLSGWDVAILPFAHNAATRFISPTKTPEYLAAGCPVVSTSIKDVVRPYGELGIISIADTADAFSQAIDFELKRRDDHAWQERVQNLLSKTSWDITWSYMSSAIETARESVEASPSVSIPVSASSGRTLSAS